VQSPRRVDPRAADEARREKFGGRGAGGTVGLPQEYGGNVNRPGIAIGPNTFGRALTGMTLACGLGGALLGAACQGGSDRGGIGTISVDIRPLVEQMGGGTGSSASGDSSRRYSGLIAGPGPSPATTAVQTLIVGAVAIGFQDTPLAADAAITDTLRDELRQAEINSSQFIALTQLPTDNPFLEFSVPPPAATHWQIVAVGTRDAIHYLDEVRDDSPIYYGFNRDHSGIPVFLSAETLGNAPIEVVMKRACVLTLPPNGCAQFRPNRTFALTAAVEIVGVYFDGSAVNALSSPALIVRTEKDVTNTGGPSGPIYSLAGIGSAASVRIDTTHQLSPANAGNATCLAASAADLYGLVPGVAGISTCSVESYTTRF
jgi:hypothetical protein